MSGKADAALISTSTESSDLLSPLSWRTAPATPSSYASLPIRGTPKTPYRRPPHVLYRPPKPLPYELVYHCLVYFEEQLYINALTLLNNLLTSGTSFPAFPLGSTFAPPPNHLAFVSNLLVHPLHTSAASSLERQEVSSESLILLRNVLAILGPVGGNLGEAFIFSSSGSRRPGAYLKKDLGSDFKTVSPSSGDGDGDIKSSLARDHALWIRAQDFWHVVGWAFNCSSRHEKRWKYWKIWLEYMIDVLKADWDERTRLDEEESKSKNFGSAKAQSCSWLGKSMLVGYLPERGSSAVRRVVKSVFADGSVESTRAFPEIFEKETQDAVRQIGTKRKRELKFDIDEGNFGDYIADDEYEESPIDLSQPPPSPPRDQNDGKSTVVAQLTIMSRPEAITLRLRLLALLSLASDTLPDAFTNIQDLYNIFYEYISSLPLPDFFSFISAAPSHLPPPALSSLCQLLLGRLLPNSAPRPPTDELTQDGLEHYFLPFAAHSSSVEDNAKVSLLLETLFRLLVTITSDSSEGYSAPINIPLKLSTAVEKGIAAREAKCAYRKKKPSGQAFKEDGHRRSYLDFSSARIRFLLKFLQSKVSTASKGRA